MGARETRAVAGARAARCGRVEGSCTVIGGNALGLEVAPGAVWACAIPIRSALNAVAPSQARQPNVLNFNEAPNQTG